MKKLLSVILAVLITATVLSACSGKKDDAKPVSDSTTQSTEATAQENESTETIAQENESTEASNDNEGEIKLKKASAADINFGKVEGSTYVNSALNLEFKAPDGFKELSAQEIAELYDTKVDSNLNKASISKYYNPENKNERYEFYDTVFINEKTNAVIAFTLRKQTKDTLMFTDRFPASVEYSVYSQDKKESYRYIDISNNEFAVKTTAFKSAQIVYDNNQTYSDSESDSMYILSGDSKAIFGIYYAFPKIEECLDLDTLIKDCFN